MNENNLEAPLLEAAGQLQQCWKTFLDQHAETLQKKAAIQQQLLQISSPHGAYVLSSWETDANLKAIYENHVQLLLARFKQLVARGGPAPEVDSDDFSDWKDPSSYRDFHDGDRDLLLYGIYCAKHAAQHDLSVVARKLLAELTPEKARDQALQQAAQRIQDAIEQGPLNNKRVVIDERAGRQVITIHRYANEFHPWELSSGDRYKLHCLLNDLRTVLSTAENHDIHVNHVVANLLHNGQFSSRQRFQAGPGLEIVMFKEKIELRFMPATLDALQYAMSICSKH